MARGRGGASGLPPAMSSGFSCTTPRAQASGKAGGWLKRALSRAKEPCERALLTREVAAAGEWEGKRRVRFANLLLPVVQQVEKLASQTDGRWTRGLHKKTSDHIAELHLQKLGQSQAPSERAKREALAGGGVYKMK